MPDKTGQSEKGNYSSVRLPDQTNIKSHPTPNISQMLGNIRGGVLTPDHILYLQRTIGNQAVRHLLANKQPSHSTQPPVIQRMEQDKVSKLMSDNYVEVTADVIKKISDSAKEYIENGESGKEIAWRRDQIRQDLEIYLRQVNDSLMMETVLEDPLLQKEISEEAEMAKAEEVKEAEDEFKIAEKILLTSTKFWEKKIKQLASAIVIPPLKEPAPPDEKIVNAIRENMEQDVVPKKERVWIECTVAQGVTGNLKHYSLTSTQFSSCSPVIMYNQNGTGGLFHYAAGSPGQHAELGEMLKIVKPTWVGLDKGPNRGPGDQDSLKEFFLSKKIAEENIHMLGDLGGSVAVSYNESQSGVPKIEKAGDDGNSMDLSLYKGELPREYSEGGVNLFVNPDFYTDQFAQAGRFT